MLGLKKKEEKIYRLIGHQNGEVAHDFILNKKKLLLGKFNGADICLDMPTISHYHAFIVIDDHGGRIIDLDSDNGVYINGKRIKDAFFSAGDSLKLGPLELHVTEEIIDVKNKDLTIENKDRDIKIIDQKQILEMPTELPPHPRLVVIDGEYCDIKFEDDHAFTPLNHIPALEGSQSYEQFIDIEERDHEIIPISQKSDDLAIEVTVMGKGNILTIDYIPLSKNKIWYLSSNHRDNKRINIPLLKENDDQSFLQIKDGHVKIFNIEGFESINLKDQSIDPFENHESINFNKDDIFNFHNQTVQVLVKIVDAPPYIRGTPFFGRDRNFQAQTTKLFSGIMCFMLLILFVDTTIEPPKKKIAVIYRKALKTKKISDTKSSSVADKKDMGTGVKKKKQPKKDIKMAKKSPVKASNPKKNISKPKKMAKAKSKPTPAPKVVKKVPKMKAYKLNVKKSLSSLMGSTKSLTPTNVKTVSQVSAKSGFSAVSASSDANLKSKSNKAVGTLGQDFSGDYDSSTGTKGLSSKAGIDTTYSDPKTVVLGSMDPELLRKILREYLPQFRHCYQQELERNENVKGIVGLNFRILQNGKVGKIRIKAKDRRFSKKGSNCMAGVLKMIDFPKPKGGGVVDVRQPLNFFSERNKL